jgi:hypothetical protein
MKMGHGTLLPKKFGKNEKQKYHNITLNNHKGVFRSSLMIF